MRGSEKNISYWRDVISQYEASGMSRKQFCSENGIVLSSFKNWICRLKNEDRPPDSPLFTPIVIKEEDAHMSEEEEGESQLLLELSGVRIVVSAGFGQLTLKHLLDVII